MITYEQDPDVLRWGLQLFDGHPLPDCGYYDANAQYNAEDYYQQQYYNEDRYDMGCISLANSELNEHDIQQLSQLSMAGAPGPCTEEQLQTTYYPQEWLGQSMENYSFGTRKLTCMICLFFLSFYYFAHFQHNSQVITMAMKRQMMADIPVHALALKGGHTVRRSGLIL